MRDDCPLLRPSRPMGRDAVAVGIYCALPDGRVRVPARDERQLYCLPGHQDDCPVYHRHVPAR
jgi:hypothetical protein